MILQSRNSYICAPSSGFFALFPCNWKLGHVDKTDYYRAGGSRGEQSDFSEDLHKKLKFFIGVWLFRRGNQAPDRNDLSNSCRAHWKTSGNGKHVFLWWTKKSLDLGQATIISEKLMDSFGTVFLHPINVPPSCAFLQESSPNKVIAYFE